MTVCIASDGFPPKAGGIVSFNWHLTQLLLEAGHSVVQLNIDRTPGAEDRTNTNGRFTQVWLGRSFQTYKNLWASYFRPGGMDAPDWIATGLAMRDWLKANSQQYKIDVVEASDFGGYGAFLSTPELPPLVLTGHASILQLSKANYYPAKEESYQLLRQLEKAAYTNAAAIITHSTQNANSIRSFTSVPVYETRMPWKVEETSLETSSHSFPTIIGIGALQPAKGIFVLVNALRLLKRQGLSVQVTWIGDDTFHSPEIYSVAEYLQKHYPDVWGTEFIWMESIPHQAVLGYLEKAEIVLLPSLFETFGYTVLEAAMFNNAIIMSDCVGAAQHFNDRENALITKAGDATELAEAIRKLYVDKEFRKKLGEATGVTLHAAFDPAIIIGQRMDTYKSIIANAPHQANGLSAAMSIINPYRKKWRKIYYKLRAMAKAIVKGR